MRGSRFNRAALAFSARGDASIWSCRFSARRAGARARVRGADGDGPVTLRSPRARLPGRSCGCGARASAGARAASGRRISTSPEVLDPAAYDIPNWRNSQTGPRSTRNRGSAPRHRAGTAAGAAGFNRPGRAGAAVCRSDPSAWLARCIITAGGFRARRPRVKGLRWYFTRSDLARVELSSTSPRILRRYEACRCLGMARPSLQPAAADARLCDAL